MELDIDKIERIKAIRKEKSVLSGEENALSAPILRDMSLISEIYALFADILSERPCPPDIRSVTQRKKFIFIILYLYSPGTLAGGKMKSGLREEMARTLGVKSVTIVSNNLEDVVFFYRNYKTFSADIGHIYTEILRRLKEKGLLK